MRRVKRSGLAGVPGIVLSEQDLRRLRFRFGAETPTSGTNLGGVRADASCATCVAPNLDRSIATEVFRYLGAPDLAAAAEDTRAPSVFSDAALLAAATREAMKFRKGEIAVLAGITSPTFAVLAGNTAKKLRGKVPDAQYTAILLLYINGAMDTAAGKNSPLARDYQKALRDLKEALQGRAVVQSIAATQTLRGIGTGLGQTTRPQYGESASWITQSDTGAEAAAYFAYNESEPPKQAFPDIDMYDAYTAAKSGPSDPVRFYPPSRESIGAIAADSKDLGTSTRAPAALDFVPYDRTIRVLWAAGVNKGRDAATALRAWERANPTPSSSDPIENAAQRTAAWIIRTADTATLRSGDRWGNIDEFGRNAAYLSLAARYGVRIVKYEEVSSGFEKHVAKMLAMASLQCLQRTAQTGSPGSSGQWTANPASTSEYVPTGPEAALYVGAWDRINVDPKIRPAAVLFSQEAYLAAYRKEPTLHALNWYGSFGYGLSRDADKLLKKSDTAPGFTSAVAGGDSTYARYITGVAIIVGTPPQLQLYWLRVRQLESLRVAGAVPPPQDTQNNTNVFLAVFNAMGPALSITLDALNQSLQVATDVLCITFKVLAGPDVGGVLCNIFAAVLKFIFSSAKAATAAVFSLLKAISGLIGKLSTGDFKGALYELFAGVNTAIIFVIGGPVADYLGVPFLKSDERGKDVTSETFMPSLERMGEDLTKRNPFFLVMLTINVIAIITTPTPQNAGTLMLTLTPITAIILLAPTAKALRATKEDWLKGYRTLVLADIQRALEAILRLIAGVIVGVMTLGDAINVMGDRLARWAEKVGGAGPATAKTLQFIVVNLQTRLTSITLSITRAFTKDSGFEMRELTDDLYALLLEFLALIPAFASETGVFDKDSMASANLIATVGAATAKDARAAYDELVANLDARAKANLANEIAMSYGGRIPDKTSAELTSDTYRAPGTKTFDLKKNLPLFAVVAAMGLTLGFMLQGSERK